MPLSILVGDSDRTFREFVIRNLQFHGAIAHGARDATDVALCLSRHYFDAILCDGLISIDAAIEGCCEAKAIECCRDTPVVMMPRGEGPREPGMRPLDASHWLLPTPFAFPWLIDTIATIVGKRYSACYGTLEHAGIRFDLDAQRVSYLGKSIALRPVEKCLLRCFLEHPSSPVTITDLVAALSTGSRPSNSAALQQQVSRLRKALAMVGASHLIRSLPPLGYALGYSDDVQTRTLTCSTSTH